MKWRGPYEGRARALKLCGGMGISNTTTHPSPGVAVVIAFRDPLLWRRGVSSFLLSGGDPHPTRGEQPCTELANPTPTDAPHGPVRPSSFA